MAINCSGKELLARRSGARDRGGSRGCRRADVADRGRDHGVVARERFGDGEERAAALPQLGCRIALDDFGTGYSSLAYITRFPPDRIKIDKAFVREVDRSASDAAIANAILSLAKSLSLTVTAEGVERSGQPRLATRAVATRSRGYLLSEPLTAAVLEQRFLSARDNDGPVSAADTGAAACRLHRLERNVQRGASRSHGVIGLSSNERASTPLMTNWTPMHDQQEPMMPVMPLIPLGPRKPRETSSRRAARSNRSLAGQRDPDDDHGVMQNRGGRSPAPSSTSRSRRRSRRGRPGSESPTA